MHPFLKTLGLGCETYAGVSDGFSSEAHGPVIPSVSPIDGTVIAHVVQGDVDDYHRVAQKASEVWERWRVCPAPVRGQVVRDIGLALRAHKKELGQLISLEMGKILAEGEGEVQEMIDMADYAVGLSRQLYGLVIPSERPMHRMVEQWHPLGVVGIVSAFNFPMAVWAWNAFVAAVCGNTSVWKPSPKTPLCAIAVQKIVDRVLKQHGYPGAMGLVVGEAHPVGEAMLADPRMVLVSATGSCKMGQRVAQVVSQRFGKTLLELGGNNALIVMDDANMALAQRAVLFGAVGTAGQRCTTTRRLLLHENIAETFTASLVKAYASVRVGNPLQEGTLMGPLIDAGAVERMMHCLEQVGDQGGEVLYGGKRIEVKGCEGGFYVQPTLVKARPDMPVVAEETFAPVLYVMTFKTLQEAVQIQNSVRQGLSSALFTESMRHAEYFLSAQGSDCGIANVNIGTSGAEIGGAFGGEKETGGGREAGSDSWKAYMRRQTQTVNGSHELPLAQGIVFS
jgi:aldehyde dehydrogenase (NAD+)